MTTDEEIESIRLKVAEANLELWGNVLVPLTTKPGWGVYFKSKSTWKKPGPVEFAGIEEIHPKSRHFD